MVSYKKEENSVYSASERSLSRAIFLAARAPSARVEVGMVATVPAAEVRTSPPAVVKAAVLMGSRKTMGWATVMLSRQTARVIANKPITFIVKLLVYSFVSND